MFSIVKSKRQKEERSDRNGTRPGWTECGGLINILWYVQT